MTEKISGMTPKNAPMAAADLFESSVPDGKGGYLTRSQTGQNIIDSIGTSTNTNLFYIANNGNDSSGLTSGRFATLQGLYTAITDATASKRYKVFDVRGIASEAVINPKPFIDIDGSGTFLTVTSSWALSTVWNTVPTNADATINYGNIIMGATPVIGADFSSCLQNGNFYRIYFKNTKFSLVNSINALGLTVSGVRRAELYIDGCQFSGLSSLNDSTILIDQGLNAFISNSILSSVNVKNTAASTSVTQALIKNCVIMGELTSGDGIILPQPLNGANANVICNIENTGNLATGNKINIQSDNTFQGTISLSMDATSWVDPVNTGSGTRDTEFFVNSSTQINTKKLLYIASNGSDTSNNDGSITKPFLTAAGMYNAISPDENNQYIVFDVRGNALENDISLKPYVQVFGFGTQLQFNTITLSSAWNSLTTNASGAFGYYENLISGAAGITLDFRTAAVGSGQKYNFYFQGNKSKLDGAMRFYGLWDSGVPVAFVYVEDVNSADIAGSTDTYIEFNYGISASITDSMAASLKVRNDSSTACTTNVTVKSNIIQGRISSGIGIELSNSTTLGSDINLKIDDTQNFAATPLKINVSSTDGGVSTITQDAVSYVAPTIGGSGVSGVNYFVNSSTLADGVKVDYTPVNFTPVQDPLLTYLSVLSMIKGIDLALASSSVTGWGPGYFYKLNLTWTNVGLSGHTVSIGEGYCRDKDNTFNITVSSPISLNITASGAGGLDTGSVTTHTWYCTHVIADSSNIKPNSGIFSLSLNSPTLPPGYDKSRFSGFVKTATLGTGVILPFMQFGLGPERTYYTSNSDSSYVILSGGNATSGAPGTVDASPVMSPLAKQVTLNYTYTPNNATNNFFLLNAYGAAVISGNVMGQLGNELVTIATDDTQHFNYYVQSALDSLNLQGYSYVEYLDIL